MKIVAIVIGVLVLLAWWPWRYVRDADGFGRWRWRANRSLRVFWIIWRSLYDQPCAVSWRRRLRVAWGLWRVQL